MDELIFSEREGFSSQENLQSYDYITGWVRTAISNIIRDLQISSADTTGTYTLDIYSLFKPYIWKVLGKHPPNSPMGGPFKYYIPAVLDKCPWYECYDILEEICQLAYQRIKESDLIQFSLEINSILARENIPWKLEQGRVIRILNPQIAQQIKEVSVLLTDPKYKGADEQFAKAIEHLNRYPKPDEENCVKDAVGALEAVANIIAGTNGKQLNEILKEEPFNPVIQPIIKQAIEKVYAYRGATPGVGHGQVGPAVVQIEEATWVLTISAATILYLTDKFP